MKTYEIELKRVSFVTITVDAINREHAEALAWEQIQSGYIDDYHGDWNIENIEEETK